MTGFILNKSKSESSKHCAEKHRNRGCLGVVGAIMLRAVQRRSLGSRPLTASFRGRNTFFLLGTTKFGESLPPLVAPGLLGSSHATRNTQGGRSARYDLHLISQDTMNFMKR